MQRQNLKSRAGNEVTKISFIDISGNEITTTPSRDIKVKLTYVLPTPSPIPVASMSGKEVINPSFENKGNPAEGWRQWNDFSNLALSSDRSHSGSFSLVGVSGYTSAYQPITVVPNSTYQLSGWIYKSSGTAYLDVGDIAQECTAYATQTNGWELVSCNFTPATNQVNIRTVTESSARVWFDDVELKELTSNDPSPSPEASVLGEEINLFPTAYKIANSMLGLSLAKEEPFNQNDLVRDWMLASGDGLKTVYVEFKVGGNWSIAYSTEITLTNSPLIVTPETGMNIDIRDPSKIPTSAQVDLLKPKSVRFVFPCTNSPANNNGCPADYHSENRIAAVPPGMKKIAVINGESTWNAPVTTPEMMITSSSDALKPWNDYLEKVYYPTLAKIVTDYGSELDVIEIWNEPDLNAGASYNPSVPPQIYSQMVDVGSGIIRSINPKIEILTGGLASGNMTNFLLSLYALDPGVFTGIDGIALHPYKTPDNLATLTPDLISLREALQEKAINKPLWITEIGIQNYPEKPTSPKNQVEFLGSVIDQLRAMSPPPQSVLWYAFTDLMTGGDGSSGWGLVDSTGAVKPVGQLFADLSTLPPPGLSSPIASSSASVGPSAAPSTASNPAPSGTGSTPASPSAKIIKNPDLNEDGKVNVFDVAIYIRKLLATELEGLDLNQDGQVNVFDFAYIKKNINL